jgi:hypothetical protein
MLAVMMGNNLLLAAFAVGIRRSAGPSRSLRWVGPLLIVSGVIGFFAQQVFPMTSRWLEPGFSDIMHGSLTGAWSVIIFAVVILGAVAYRGWFRLYSIVTLLVLGGFGSE